MLIDDIATYLAAGGLGTVGVDIAKGMMPDQPDNVLVLYPTGGYPPDPVLPDVGLTVQVRVRDKSYSQAQVRIWQAFNLLDRPGNRLAVVDGRKMVVQALQPPFFLEQDGNGRFSFAFNISARTRRD